VLVGGMAAAALSFTLISAILRRRARKEQAARFDVLRFCHVDVVTLSGTTPGALSITIIVYDGY
jgi:hypothetical protein